MANAKKGGSSQNRRNSKKSSKRGASAYNKAAKESRLDDMEFKRDIGLFLVCGLAVLLFLCNFGVCGMIGNYIADFLFGTFGLLNYIFPFIFVGSVFFLISNYENRVALIKCVTVYLLYLLLSTFLGIFTYGRIGDTALNAIDCYLYGYQNHLGGGFFGGLLTGLLVKGFGKIGAYLIVILLIAVLIFLLIERTPVRAMIYGGKAAESKVRERLSNREQDRYDDEEDEIIEEAPKKRKKHSLPPEEITIPESKRDEITRDDREPSNTSRSKKKVSGITDTNLTPIQDRVVVNRQSDDMTEIQSGAHSTVRVEPPADASQAIVRKADINTVAKGQPAAERTVTTRKTINPIGIPNSMAESSTIDDAIIGAEDPDSAAVILNESAESRVSHPKHVAESAPAAEQAKPVNATKQAKASNSAGPEGVTQIDREIQTVQATAKPKKTTAYVPPSISLLKPAKNVVKDSQESLYQTAQKLEKTLSNFGIEAQVVDISQGPSVTRYEVQPAVGVKVSRIVNLSDDLKLNLAATDIRIEAPVPGKSVVGIEIPNKNAVTVSFRELIDSPDFKASKSLISFAAGRDLTGKIVIADIDKMPHVLIAGATGSGKSVCINTIIMSILYHTGPEDVKFIMVDPKIVELSVYNGIPHLLIPVVTDPKKAAGALMWAVKEMTERYQKFADAGVRKIDDYNAKIVDGFIKKTVNGEIIAEPVNKMPRIVIIVDELADLMMVASSEVEDAITRLTQLARAAGIHLIIATQRPSADVITGVIKANMPSRIAFAVTSAINSRIILDTSGAEKLLGKGDMLYYPQGFPQPLRVQGAFVSDDEIADVCSYLKTMDFETDESQNTIQSQIDTISIGNASGQGTVSISSDDTGDEKDSLFDEAGRLIIETEKASIGMLQRKFKIGFNRAARIMDQLCEAGVVGGEEGTKPRKILMTMEEFEEITQ